MDDSEPVELPRGIALAWGVAANPQRGPKREMSVERIVETAVELADAEGLGAVSMAAVAKRLGFTPMSLYRYVSAKDDLLLLMQEEATGPPSGDFREVDGWREKLLVLFREQVGVFIRHPWLLSLPISGSPVTPNGSLWVEAGLTALEGLPFESDERIAIVLAVSGSARWNGMVVAGYSDQERRTGLSAQEIAERESALFDAVISADEYPRLRAAIDAGVFVSEHDPFRFGVDRLLDGVSAYLAGRESGAPAALVPEWAEPDDADVADDKRYRTAVKATAEAEKGVRQAEKLLRQARKQQRLALREARERATP
ncbi:MULTISPECIES: TetR/AcrR family transcriptional regulator [unclassified Microbacterium]|uniref:TetR/AcrR family transcriptional regulator n=1 Tax=unclassified Microbacterium TaxID=2609290 RepID=UPI00097F212E|nr:TetR family transcriptional regulator [Microbacterium sp. JB110]RCS57918.1 TetR/AcrR family transcriptional regulator [Microbacterium sp. JB110]SJM56240.1 Transcriptional regulator, TetR family [Frigoribacterium sp. JB110]